MSPISQSGKVSWDETMSAFLLELNQLSKTVFPRLHLLWMFRLFEFVLPVESPVSQLLSLFRGHVWWQSFLELAMLDRLSTVLELFGAAFKNKPRMMTRKRSAWRAPLLESELERNHARLSCKPALDRKSGKVSDSS